jgi:hypothetical protein
MMIAHRFQRLDDYRLGRREAIGGAGHRIGLIRGELSSAFSFEAGYFPVQKRRRQYQPTPGPPMRANTRRLWAYCCRQAGSLGV